MDTHLTPLDKIEMLSIDSLSSEESIRESSICTFALEDSPNVYKKVFQHFTLYQYRMNLFVMDTNLLSNRQKKKMSR